MTPARNPAQTERTPELLLETGLKLFARKGYDGTTVKELADEAGVNVSLISYYFDGKEGLFKACLEHVGRERLAVSEKLLAPASTPEELRIRLEIFVGEMLEYFCTHSDHTRMILREIEKERGGVPSDVFERTFFKVFTVLVDFFKSAHKAGLIREELDPMLLGSIFRGVLSHIARTDFLNKKYFNQTIADPRYREKVKNQLLSLMLHGCLAQPGARPGEAS